MQKIKTISLLSMGSALEFYDFTIYGLFSAFMENSFFPKSSNGSLHGFIGILLIFGVGYIARPIGGMIFGSLGDKYGRKYSFRISLIIMALSTMSIALIPSYMQIGIYAPILLLLLRIAQGISIGAELPISCVFVFEHLSMGKNIFYGATLFGLSNIGLLLGNIINFILTRNLSYTQTHSFGWRIPFVLGGILCVLAFYLRKHLNETNVFTSMQPLRTPLKYLIKNYKLKFMAATFLALAYGICINFGFVLLFTILEHLYNTPEKVLSELTLLSTLVFCCLDSLIGMLADKFKIKLFTLLTMGFVQFSLAFYCVLYSYAHGNFVYGLGAMLWLTFAASCFDSAIPNILPRIFEDNIRSSGVATSYSLGLALSGVVSVIVSTITVRSNQPLWLIPLI
ncbi:MAG: hypothetical protein RL017_268, partial [Pseudomonadota bacterium]